ncbi:hypothetical protein M23134_08448 [Microscilla marina ATCC 23134]|uniref:Uncharacterized protein n=1 Tax=Microscilla marina ATCC 23134 TaxID=313606 RepID=A1ZR85_MICM2|nr:hypothetical protein M23134_08448 [Microscilla marina ATCC 23134]
MLFCSVLGVVFDYLTFLRTFSDKSLFGFFIKRKPLLCT